MCVCVCLCVCVCVCVLYRRMRSVRCGGSCALGLCNVAAGRLDAFYEVRCGEAGRPDTVGCAGAMGHCFKNEN